MTILTRRMVEKPWGRDVLPQPFDAPEGQRIGEIWFEPPPAMPTLLVKYIFTSEKLSVQVHPNDDQAASFGETGAGKEECWLVIDAEPGATVGIGFKEPVDAPTLRRSALDGSIEELMNWYPAKQGDFFYIPAGTVHAIGAGVSLIEVQQNSDITYRLFDYGRPRELHLEKGVSVARGEPHDPALRRTIAPVGTVQLADGPYFVVHRVQGLPDALVLGRYRAACLALPLSGTLQVDGISVHPGQCGLAPSIDAITFAQNGAAIVIAAL